jgi:nucleotide-binding universal stress UspA family protein
MFKRILVPLDGSEVAEGILPYVSQFARGMGASLVLHTVIDPESIVAPEGNTLREERMVAAHMVDNPTMYERGIPTVTEATRRSQIEIDVLEGIKADLDIVAMGIAADGIEVSVMVTLGSPVEEIIRIAEEKECDLIAMATRGRNAIERGILGSVTDKIIHSSRLPTLTITPEKAEKYRKGEVAISRIVVPLDGSELAETALPIVVEIARAMELDVVLARAVRGEEFYLSYAYGYGPAGFPDLNKELHREAKEYLEEIAVDVRSRGANVSTRLLDDPAAGAIIDHARKSPTDLIALTTHGRTGLSRWILGSVAEALVRASGDPVLVIPPNMDRAE